MSYILDALRRAEAERDRGGVPGLNARPLPGPALPDAGRRPAWAWGLAAAAGLLLLTLGAAVWLLWQRGPLPAAEPPLRAAAVDAQAPSMPSTPALPQAQPAPSTTSAPTDTATPTPTSMPTAPPAADGSAAAAPQSPPPRPSPNGPRGTTSQGVAERPAPSATASTSPLRPAVPSTSPSTSPSTPPTTARPAPADATSRSASAAERRIYAVDELPPEIRASLPTVAVSGSIYSEDAASRFLMVAGEVVHEGDRLGPELTLEQIQPKTAVLRYKGYRYRIRF